MQSPPQSQRPSVDEPDDPSYSGSAVADIASVVSVFDFRVEVEWSPGEIVVDRSAIKTIGSRSEPRQSGSILILSLDRAIVTFPAFPPHRCSAEPDVLYFISWLTDFALVLFVFAGTRHLAEQNASPLLLGVLGASFFLASAISNTCSGRVADRIGRRIVSLSGTGLLFGSLVAVASVSAESFWFHVAYTAVGISVGLIYPPIMAWLGHGKRGRSASRAYLWFCLAFNSGMLSAQLTGGWMFEQLGSRAPLLVAMGLTAVSFFCLLFLTESEVRHDGPKPEPTVDETKDVCLARAFMRLNWIANFGGMFSMSILWFLFPILVVQLDVAPAVHGIVLAAGRLVVMSSYCAMYLLPLWQYRFRFAALAQIAGCVGLIVISQADSVQALMFGVAALSVMMGHNYFASLFYAASGHAPQRKGRAFGLIEASLGLGAAGGSFFGGLAGSDLGSRAPFLIGASLVAVLLVAQAVAYWKFVRPIRRTRDLRDGEPTAASSASIEVV